MKNRIKKLTSFALITSMSIANISSVFAQVDYSSYKNYYYYENYEDSPYYDGTHMETVLGLIDRGNHKNANLEGSTITVPRPAKSQYAGGYANGGTNDYTLENLKADLLTSKRFDVATKNVNGTIQNLYFTTGENTTLTFAELFYFLSKFNFRPVDYTGAYAYNTGVMENGEFIAWNSNLEIEEWYFNPVAIGFESGFIGEQTALKENNIPLKMKSDYDNITREDMFYILSNMLDYDDTKMLNKPILAKDKASLSADEATIKATNALLTNAIISLDKNGNLRPKDKVTYGEFYSMIEKIFSLYNNDKLAIHDNLYGNYYKYTWSYEKIFFDEVNEDRVNNGTYKLTYDSTLEAFARLRCIDMVTMNQGLDNHTSRTYGSTYKLENGLGLIGGVGENIGGTNTDYREDTINKTYNDHFMASPGHRRSVLADKTTMAIGVLDGFTVQNFR